MIITREMILEITCSESVEWFKAHPEYFGLTRKQFMRKFKQDENLGLTPNKWWAAWGDENFFKGDAIILTGKVKRLGVYKVVAPGLTEQEFDNIDDALELLEAAKNNRVKEEDPFFHVHIRRSHGASGYQNLGECDTTKDTCELPTADAYFSTFNLITGQYEDFLTYGQAKNRMIELRKNRIESIADGYLVQEKIREIDTEDNLLSEDFVIVQSVTGKHTLNLRKLDRIERRPDRKPKPPKPPKP